MNKKLSDVLVLNKSWVAIHIVDWKKAMSLIYQDAARSLDMDFIAYDFSMWLEFSTSKPSNDYPKVHTSTKEIAIPEIVVLTKYDRLPSRDVKYSRQTLFERDSYRCAYCGKHFPRPELTVDHIIPRSKGGKTNWDNTVSACRQCNFLKANRTPQEAKMPLLLKPKKPKWISPLHKVGGHRLLKSWQRFSDRAPV